MNKKLFERLRKICAGWQLKHRPRKITHFTFILDGAKIISMGVNYTQKTHVKSEHSFRRIHSELDAILKVQIRGENKKYHMQNVAALFNSCTVANFRIMADGSVGMAKPCKFCEKLLEDLGFKDIWWSTEYVYDCSCK